MELPPILSQKKSIIIELVILVAFLGGMYYLYTIFSQDTPTTSSGSSAINQQLIGQNLALFLKAVNQDKFSLKDSSFLQSSFVGQLKDFSEVITTNQTRGRSDPFTPYASSRSLR